MPYFKGNLLRSVDIYGEQELNEYLKQFESEFYTSLQYMSTTKGPIYNPEARVQIYIQNSSKGRDLSGSNDTEKEVLYERNSKFKVIDKAFENGVHYILLEEA